MSIRVDKASFLAAVPCHAKGWLTAREPWTPPGYGLQWRFHEGALIGQAAHALLGPGRDLPKAPLDLAMTASKDAMTGDQGLLYEPTVAAGSFVARADALRRVGESWDLIEVKSGKSPPDGKPKARYLDDIAYSTAVAQLAGVDVQRSILVLIRPDYKLGDPDHSLLVELDVTLSVAERVQAFIAAAREIEQAVCGETTPNPVWTFECKDCEFFDQCLGRGLTHPVFDLPRLSPKRFNNLSCRSILEIPPDAELTAAQERVVRCAQSGKPLVEPEGLKYLDELKWPAYYLDFEGLGTAIPMFRDLEPYDAVPFQYSLHVCESAEDEPRHEYFLADLSGDWRRTLAEKLLHDVGDRGSILMYTPYEDQMIGHLERTLPDLAEGLGKLRSRLFDLEPLFRHGYYHPNFRGKTSIKKTLPVVVPDLTYEGLTVRKGDDASGLFGLMRVGRFTAEECKVHQSNLLDYCRMDTLAMVRLHRALLGLRQL